MDLRVPKTTPYDVRFRLFGAPVRIHPDFWVLHGLFGVVCACWRGPGSFFIYVGSIFASLLIHELGHVLAGRAFGAGAEIVLTPLYGLAFVATADGAA